MTFRTRLFVNFMLALLLSVGLIAAGVTVVTRRAFDELNREHTEALLAQFQREFDRRRIEVAERVKGIADDGPTVRMAIDLSRPNADVSVYVNDAHGVSKSHQLDLLDFVNNDGTIISSQESPARFNYKMEWVTKPEDWPARGAFLTRLDTEAGPALALLSVATVRVGDRDLYVVGGERLGNEFLASLALPANMRALLYLNLDPEFQEANLLDAKGPRPMRSASRRWWRRKRPIRWSGPRRSAGALIRRARKYSRRCRYWEGPRNCWACCSWAARNAPW